MTVTAESTGTTLADGTEQTLTTHAGAGVYLMRIGLENMAGGDTTIVRCKVTIGDVTVRTLIEQTFSGVQSPDAFDFDPVINDAVGDAPVWTLEQTGGVNRNYRWRLLLDA